MTIREIIGKGGAASTARAQTGMAISAAGMADITMIAVMVGAMPGLENAAVSVAQGTGRVEMTGIPVEATATEL